MSCKCGKNCKDNCGCNNKGLTSLPPCNNPACPTPELCPETFSSECIVFMGNDIVDLGINQGDRLTEIIQKLVLAITDPSCIMPTNNCNSALNLHVTNMYTGSINIAWNPVSTATGYQVEFKEVSSLTWILNPVLPLSQNPTDVIAGLLPSKTYYIRVKTICSSGTCNSVTISVTTPAS